MSRLRVLSLIGVAAGVWLLAAPFVLDLPHVYPYQRAFLSSLAIGAVVLALSVVHGLRWELGRRAARINLCLGLLLLASPVFFGYGHFSGAGEPATVSAVVSGLVIVAGAVLSLAGSGVRDAAPRDRVPAPALWTEPVAGGPPQPFVGRADGGTSTQSDQETAREKLPFAWTAVGLMLVAAVLLAFAFVLVSWQLGVVGLVVGGAGLALALRVRILSDVSLGQRPEGP